MRNSTITQTLQQTIWSAWPDYNRKQNRDHRATKESSTLVLIWNPDVSQRQEVWHFSWLWGYLGSSHGQIPLPGLKKWKQVVWRGTNGIFTLFLLYCNLFSFQASRWTGLENWRSRGPESLQWSELAFPLCYSNHTGVLYVFCKTSHLIWKIFVLI